MLPLRFYWMLFLRRLPLMMALMIICSAIAIYASLKLPPVFSSTARLQVEAPQIPDNMVVSLVRTDASEQLQLIQEQLMTRANLLDIARKYSVFENLNEMSPDRIVQSMQENTRIRRSSGRNQATLMSISFNASSGQIAANVVNDYVTLVLESNSAFRRARAENTLSFFELATDQLAREIDDQSNRIIQFKNENVEALPDDLNYRQNRQSTLQERLGRLEQERASIINQRNEMVSLFEATGRLDRPQEDLSPDQRRLQELEQQLRESLVVYSETNPKILLLKKQIAQVESSLEVASVTAASEGDGGREASIIDVTLAELDQRVAQIDQEIVGVTEELDLLARSIAATATNSITLERLERDLESIRTRYNATLNNLNQARMAERVEVNAQGQRVSLIEGAVVPQEPSGPPRKKIAAAGVGGGMMLAIAVFVLFEMLNQKIRHPSEIQQRFDFSPIGVIPYMESKGERLRRRGLLLLACVATLTLVPLALYYIHTEYMPLDLVADRILQQLGMI